MQAKIISTRSVSCDCGKFSFPVEDALSGKWEPPYPNFQRTCTKCGQVWSFTFNIGAQAVDMEKVGDPVLAHVLLRQEGSSNPIWLILKDPLCNAEQMAKEAAERGSSTLPYLYNDHNCPTNFIRGIELIVQNSDADPHGLFEFVRVISDDEFQKAAAYHDSKQAAYQRLFPEAFAPAHVRRNSNNKA